MIREKIKREVDECHILQHGRPPGEELPGPKCSGTYPGYGALL